MPLISVNLERTQYKKYLALIILLFIYLLLPVISIILVYLIIYTGYRWITLSRPWILNEVLMNILLTSLALAVGYVLMLIIRWLRE